MYHVYIIKSLNSPEKIYVGRTSNLNQRLSDHNYGTTAHTAKNTPWELITYISFKDEGKALAFEKYLKSGSGRAFRDKRLL
jgi:putative endonuclease